MANTNTIPYTLPLSIFLTGLTSVVVEQREIEQIMNPSWQDDLINLFTVGTVEKGKGIIYNFEKKKGDMEQYSKTSSLFTLREGEGVTEIIEVDTYEFTATSIRRAIARESFVDSTIMDAFLNLLYARNRKTMQIDMANKALTLFKGFVPTQATQTITSHLWDTTQATSASEEATMKATNASILSEDYQNALDALTIYSNKYTDDDTIFTQGEHGQIASIMNKAYYNSWLGNAFATTFNSGNLSDALPNPNVKLPSELMDATHFATYFVKPKFAIAMGYMEGYSNFDASNQFTTFFDHRACGLGVFKSVPAIKHNVVYDKGQPSGGTR